MSQPDEKGKVVGRVRAITTLSPVLPDRRPELTRALRLVRWIPNAGRPLQALAFIHYGRWLVLDDLPDPTGRGAQPHALNSSYLLFESNYDGGVSDYLDAFSDTLPHRLARLWGNCVAFEKDVISDDGREVVPWAFREYVRANELKVLHFYAACPHETVLAIRAAIVLDERLRRKPADSSKRSATAEIEIKTMAAGPAPDGISRRRKLMQILGDWRAAVRKRYGVNPLTIVAPIRDGARCEQLQNELGSLPYEQGPLAKVEGTSFARFVLIPDDLPDLGQRPLDRLPVPYLLFTSNHVGSSDDYIERLRTAMAQEADAIWGCCAAYPGADDRAGFTEWFRRHERPTEYFVAGYPARSAREIRAVIDQRQRLAVQLR